MRKMEELKAMRTMDDVRAMRKKFKLDQKYKGGVIMFVGDYFITVLFGNGRKETFHYVDM